MKTTIDIDADLLRRAKRVAATSGTTLRQVVEDALRVHLLPRGPRRERFHLELPTERGTAPPAVDVDDRHVLYEVMDGNA